MEGWKQTTIGEICTLRNGPAYKKDDLLDSGKYPVLRVGNFFTNRHWYYSDFELDDTKYCDTGDLLYAWSASFGPRIWEGEKVIFHYHIWRVDFDVTQVSKKFLYYWFEWDADSIKKAQGAGTTMTHVSMKSMNARAISLPPLAEQERIVAILDEAFTAIATATVNVERNLVNARGVFERLLDAAFSQSGEGWLEKKFGDAELIQIIDGDRGVNYPSKSDFHSDGHCLFLNTKNVRPDGFDFETTMFITEEKDKALRKGKLRRRDVLLTTRGTIGNIALYDDSVEFDHIRINSGMLILRPNEKLILSEYLFEVLRSAFVKRQIAEFTSGAAQPQLPIKTLVQLVLPVPNRLKVQARLIEKLRDQSDQVKQLEAIYQQKLVLLAELKQSLLHQAFTGALTR